MAATLDRRSCRLRLLGWLLLITSMTACDNVDCSNIATTGCAGSTLYHVYDRPARD